MGTRETEELPPASVGHKYVSSMKLWESCFNSGWKGFFSAGNMALAANK